MQSQYFKILKSIPYENLEKTAVDELLNRFQLTLKQSSEGFFKKRISKSALLEGERLLKTYKDNTEKDSIKRLIESLRQAGLIPGGENSELNNLLSALFSYFPEYLSTELERNLKLDFAWAKRILRKYTPHSAVDLKEHGIKEVKDLLRTGIKEEKDSFQTEVKKAKDVSQQEINETRKLPEFEITFSNSDYDIEDLDEIIKEEKIDLKAINLKAEFEKLEKWSWEKDVDSKIKKLIVLLCKSPIEDCKKQIEELLKKIPEINEALVRAKAPTKIMNLFSNSLSLMNGIFANRKFFPASVLPVMIEKYIEKLWQFMSIERSIADKYDGSSELFKNIPGVISELNNKDDIRKVFDIFLSLPERNLTNFNWFPIVDKSICVAQSQELDLVTDRILDSTDSLNEDFDPHVALEAINLLAKIAKQECENVGQAEEYHQRRIRILNKLMELLDYSSFEQNVLKALEMSKEHHDSDFTPKNVGDAINAIIPSLTLRERITLARQVLVSGFDSTLPDIHKSILSRLQEMHENFATLQMKSLKLNDEVTHKILRMGM